MLMGGNNLPCPSPRDSLGIQGLEWLCGVPFFHGRCLMVGIGAFPVELLVWHWEGLPGPPQSPSISSG